MADTDPVRLQNGFTKDYNGEPMTIYKISYMIQFNMVYYGHNTV